MQVKIVRNTGVYGSAGHMNVKVDGEKVGRIVHGERSYFPLKNKTGKLQIQIYGSKSNVLDVTDGDVVELTTVPRAWHTWFVSFLFMLAIIAVTDRVLKLSLFSVVILINLSKFFWNEYRIAKKKEL